MPFYYFVCEAGHKTELRKNYDVSEVECPVCGKPAYREAIYRDQYLVTETGMKMGAK